jgi:Zn-dependent peptidase ImmA (M78 family)
MEEVSHVFLGHKANRLAAITKDEPPGNSTLNPTQKAGRMLARDYNQVDEEAAYAVGAAALAPFGALRRHVMDGRNSREIARHFRVSRQLIEYRIKVTHLWPEYKRLSAMRPEHV